MNPKTNVPHVACIALTQKEIIHEYPDAKIVLTSRDPDSWWESVKGTIHSQSPVKHTWGELTIRPQRFSMCRREEN